MTTLRAGELNRRISIQVNTPTQDTFGEEIESWAEIAGGSVWAGVVYKSGGERSVGPQLASLGQVVFTIRHRTGLTAKHRIVYDGRTYNILEVQDTGNAAALVIVAEVRMD